MKTKSAPLPYVPLSPHEGVLAWLAANEPAIEFTIPAPSPSLNSIKNLHPQPYRRLRLKFRELVLDAFKEKGGLPPPLSGRVYIQVIRGCYGKGLDWDNAIGGLKPLVDCLVTPSATSPSGLGLIQNDSPEFMPMAPHVVRAPAEKCKGFTTVKIYQL